MIVLIRPHDQDHYCSARTLRAHAETHSTFCVRDRYTRCGRECPHRPCGCDQCTSAWLSSLNARLGSMNRSSMRREDIVTHWTDRRGLEICSVRYLCDYALPKARSAVKLEGALARPLSASHPCARRESVQSRLKSALKFQTQAGSVSLTIDDY